jgi:hypothetical protein
MSTLITSYANGDHVLQNRFVPGAQISPPDAMRRDALNQPPLSLLMITATMAPRYVTSIVT